MSPRRRLLPPLLALGFATLIWLSVVHVCFRPNLDDYVLTGGISPRARALAARHLALWTKPELRAAELKRMRGSNAEWDFMGRTFLVLALANMSLREPAEKAQHLDVIDQVIADTIAVEKEKSVYHFLMDYARAGKWVNTGERSVFVDGEIALMMAARRFLEEREDYGLAMTARLAIIEEAMRKSPVLNGESYPDECWLFCNTAALAAMCLADVLDGTDHSELFREWIATAKDKLTDKTTGLLHSSYSVRGRPKDGPEGSSIWMAAHCLQVIDPDFAADQYARAKKELGKTLLGFGYAAEWPQSYRGPQDVDSGPIIPILEASAGSSGLAFLGASTFGDRDFLRQLITSLEFAAFPLRQQGTLKYCASNQVGDAVLLYALVCGPLWDKVTSGRRP